MDIFKISRRNKSESKKRSSRESREDVYLIDVYYLNCTIFRSK